MIDALVLTVVMHSASPQIEKPALPVISRSMHAPQMNNVHTRDSSYRGDFYRPGQEEFRKCIVERESNGHAWSRSKSRTYQGAYQMSNDLWVGATYMMTAELKRDYGSRIGKLIARELRTIPASKAATRWQTQAFYTILNWEYDYSGKSHWSGGRWHCS